MLLGHRCRDESAPVTSLRDVLVVFEPLHKNAESLRSSFGIPSGRTGFVREPESGQRWDHNMESVVRRSAVRSRVNQRFDNVEKQQRRTRPTVDENDGLSRLMVRPGMNVVNAESVYVDLELRPFRECSFGFAPVVFRSPVLYDRLHLSEWRPLHEAWFRRPLRPAGCQQAPLQVCQILVARMKVERLVLRLRHC